MSNLYNVEAEYHMELFSKKTGEFFGHRVKVMVLDDDLGFFINGMVVSPPECTKEKIWMVYTPTQGKARIIEFNGQKSKLWPEIKEACLNVVWEYLRQSKLDSNNDKALDSNQSQEDFNKEMMKGMEDLGY